MQLPVSLYSAAIPHDDGERQLIEQAKNDRQAFAVLYRRHYPMIAGYIYRRVGNAHLTEDLVAEVFLTAMRYLPRYRQRGAPWRAWLYRIATSTLTRWVKRERRRLVVEEERMLHTPGATSADSKPDAERARVAMLTLPPKHQAVLSLHYLEGMSLEEVAATIGCRLGTVKSRLSRGRDALREKLVRMQAAHEKPPAARKES